MTTAETLNVVFTGVIAASTIMYTVVSHRQWKATRDSVDVAKFNAFMTYMLALAAQIEQMKPNDPGAAAFLEKMLAAMADIAMPRLLGDIDFAADGDAQRDLTKLADLLQTHGLDPTAVPGIGKVFARLRSPAP